MESNDRTRLDALHQKLKEVEARRAKPEEQNMAAQKITNMGIAYRMVIEMAAGIGIGAAMGLGLDWLFNTKPLFLVVMCLLGFAAGIRIMMQSAREFEAQRKDEEENGN